MTKRESISSHIQTWEDAVVAILAGTGFLWKNKKIPMLFVLSLFFGQNVISWYKVATDPISTLKAAHPIQAAQPSGFRFDLMPDEAIASGVPQGVAIIINGKVYGYADTNYVAWKLLDKDAIVLYYKPYDVIAIANTRPIDKSVMLKLKAAQQ